MQGRVIWANPDETVQQVLAKMQQYDTGYIMVGVDGVLEGIVSRSDITGALSPYLRSIFAKWRRPLDDATLKIKIKWIMSRPVRTVKPQTPLATIMEHVCRFGGSGLPVVDEQGKVQGLVTVFNVFQTMLNTCADVSTVGRAPQTPPLT
jgi:CBS domain-containing protein